MVESTTPIASKTVSNDCPEETVWIRQQSDHFVNLLLAQRQIYSDYKQNRYYWMLAVIAIGICVTAAAVFFPALNVYVVVLAGVAAVAEFWLSESITRRRGNAALIQEMYDCELLCMPLNPTDPGKVDANIIGRAAERLRATEPNLRGLREWYAQKNADHPIRRARLLCQMENLLWDKELRQKWIPYLVKWLIGIAIGAVFVALFMQLSFESTILIPILLVASPVYYITDTIRKNQSVIKIQEDQKAYANTLLPKVDDSAVSDEEMMHLCRQLQDKILAYRRDSVAVPDWFFNENKEEIEGDVNRPELP